MELYGIQGYNPGVIPPGLLELLMWSYRSYGVIRSYPREMEL